MAKQYKQIGNAVFVNLAIGKEIIALELQRQRDYDELKALDKDISSALYKLAFNTYEGF